MKLLLILLLTTSDLYSATKASPDRFDEFLIEAPHSIYSETLAKSLNGTFTYQDLNSFYKSVDENSADTFKFPAKIGEVPDDETFSQDMREIILEREANIDNDVVKLLERRRRSNNNSIGGEQELQDLQSKRTITDVINSDPGLLFGENENPNLMARNADPGLKGQNADPGLKGRNADLPPPSDTTTAVIPVKLQLKKKKNKTETSTAAPESPDGSSSSTAAPTTTTTTKRRKCSNDRKKRIRVDGKTVCWTRKEFNAKMFKIRSTVTKNIKPCPTDLPCKEWATCLHLWPTGFIDSHLAINTETETKYFDILFNGIDDQTRKDIKKFMHECYEIYGLLQPFTGQSSHQHRRRRRNGPVQISTGLTNCRARIMDVQECVGYGVWRVICDD